MQELQLPDNELVKRTLNNPEDFGILIDKYTPKLRRYIRRITNIAEEDIEDTLQDIFIKVYQHLRGFDEQCSFSSWIYRIAHNTVISAHRKRLARPQTDVSEHAIEQLVSLASSLETDAEVLAKEDTALVEQALGMLPIKYKEVLVLRYLEERSYDEISDILKKPPGTVATLLNRAKKKLKQTLTSSL